LGLEGADDDSFPHENKGENANTFLDDLWSKSEYRTKYVEELAEYLKQFGIVVTDSNWHFGQTI